MKAPPFVAIRYCWNEIRKHGNFDTTYTKYRTVLWDWPWLGLSFLTFVPIIVCVDIILLLVKMVCNLGIAATGSGRPLNAEFLFYLFLDPQNCDAIVGDLEDRYKLIYAKFGSHRANFWYWTQAVRSVGPIVWAWAKKVSMKPFVAAVAWAVARGLVGHDSWLAALLELYRKIRS
jgi:hypothetical protein